MRLLLALLMLSLLIANTACQTIDQGLMAVSDGISSADPVTGKRQVALVSEQEEINLAESFTAQALQHAAESETPINAATPYYADVKRVFDRLVGVAHRPHLPWEVHVVTDPSFNAFTIGGGKVFVHTGLFESELVVESEDELAAVLAHEIAHVTARHTAERGGQQALAGIATKSATTDRYRASFTTVQEDEADRLSTLYAALAGYDPGAAVDLWRRAHAVGGSASTSLLHDHPLNDERAANLAEYAALTRQYYVAGEINPDREALLVSNTLYTTQAKSDVKPGEGGGFLALLETTTGMLEQVNTVKGEEQARYIKQQQDINRAMRRIWLTNTRIARTTEGGVALFGNIQNRTGTPIVRANALLYYYDGSGQVAQTQEVALPALAPYESRALGFPLTATVPYMSVVMQPVYVQLTTD